MSQKAPDHEYPKVQVSTKLIPHHSPPPCPPKQRLSVREASLSAPATPSCCQGRRHKVEMLEKQNMELVQRLRKEQDKLEEQEKRFKTQLDNISSEHSRNLNKMGILLSNQKKVTHFLFSHFPDNFLIFHLKPEWK